MTVLLGYSFSQPALAAAALRHPSLPGKRAAGEEHFERLEFLGDRVLGLTVADMLMKRFPQEAEGPLTRRHTSLVRAGTLASIARSSGIADQLQRAGHDVPGENILADAFEAVIGAIFLDSGYEAAAAVVRAQLSGWLEQEPTDQRDPKTRLQELAQSQGPQLPAYEVLDQQGPSHAPFFRVIVKLANGAQATGEGGSKRAAEQAAALALLNKVEKHG